MTTHDTLVDQHSQWSHIPCQSQIENTPGETHECICTSCKNFLEKKNPYMPAQACANGLHIPTIPQELKDITPLER